MYPVVLLSPNLANGNCTNAMEWQKWGNNLKDAAVVDTSLNHATERVIHVKFSIAFVIGLP